MVPLYNNLTVRRKDNRCFGLKSLYVLVFPTHTTYVYICIWMMYELELWAKLCMRILLLHMHVIKDTFWIGLAKLAFILLIYENLRSSHSASSANQKWPIKGVIKL